MLTTYFFKVLVLSQIKFSLGCEMKCCQSEYIIIVFLDKSTVKVTHATLKSWPTVLQTYC